MKFVQKLIQNRFHLLSVAVAFLLVVFSGPLIYWFDPTAGSFSLGYLQRPIMAAAYYFFALISVKTLFHLEFGWMDQWIDQGKLEEAWMDGLTQQKQVQLTLLTLAVLFAGYLVCLWLVPVG